MKRTNPASSIQSPALVAHHPSSIIHHPSIGEALAFSPIVRTVKRSEAAAEELARLQVADEPQQNRLEVRNEGDTAEIILIGRVGSSYWDESGITEKEFRNALNAIPKGKPITISVNSEGGSVKEGLGIHDAIESRKADIRVRIAGYALSIASVFPLAAKKSNGGRGVVSPKSAIWMEHQAWTYASGNADEMRAAASMLDAHDKSIINIYAAATGKDKATVLERMKATTWTTGADAVTAGLADETDDAEDSQASYRPLTPDLMYEARRRAPQILNAIQATPLSAPVQGAAKTNNQKTQIIMNRQQMLALLKSWGVETNDQMTDDQLVALVGQGKPEGKGTQTTGAGAKPGTPTNANDSVITKADLEKILAKVTTDVTAKANEEIKRELRIDSALDKLVLENRLTKEEAAKWKPRCVADDSVLADLQQWPAKPEPAEPVGAEGLTTEGAVNVAEMERALANYRKPLIAAISGNLTVDEKVRQAMRTGSVRIAAMMNKHFGKIGEAVNTNNISADLQRNAILSMAMRAFKRRIISLSIFSTRFENVPLEGTNKIAVPFYPLDTAASNDYADATGYEFDEDSNTEDRDVTINKRKYKPFNFYSHQLTRQPFFDIVRLMEMKAEQLAIDVWTDVLSIFTNGNYGAAAFVGGAGAFDSDKVMDVEGVCDDADWPDVGRSLVLAREYHTNLLKDPALKQMDRSGSTQSLREGVTGRVGAFDIYKSVRLPANAENLVGLAVLPQAALVAFAPIMPAPGVRRQLLSYDVVSDPDSGATFEYRHWGNPDKDEEREVVESNYGYNKGDAAAAKRLTSA